LDAYTKCLNIAPRDWIGRATVTGNRAAVNFMMGKYMECVDDCDDSLRLDSTLVKLHIRKGKALIKLGHFHDAEAAFNVVLLLNIQQFQLIVSDEEYLQGLDQSIQGVKLEANAGVREISKIKDTISKLLVSDAKKDYWDVIKLAEEILQRSPFHRHAIEAKARALCELSRYEQAKKYIEESTIQCPNNIRVMHAHEQAPIQCPTLEELTWTMESKDSNIAKVILTHVKNMIFCMGSELAFIYLHSLKNVPISRNCSADVMNKILSLLESLQVVLGPTDLLDAWSWVQREVQKMKELIALKNTGDQQFKEKNYRAALYSYSNALKIDLTAKRWGAILHCNRAAAQIGLKMFAEAVVDCNQAIHLDGDYARAYLRRARAFRVSILYYTI
jgi:DnaJ homolog subfamily C member 7